MATPCEGIPLSGDWLDGVRWDIARSQKLAHLLLIGHRRVGFLPLLLLSLLCLGALCGTGPEVCRDLGCPAIYYYSEIKCLLRSLLRSLSLQFANWDGNITWILNAVMQSRDGSQEERYEQRM